MGITVGVGHVVRLAKIKCFGEASDSQNIEIAALERNSQNGCC